MLLAEILANTVNMLWQILSSFELLQSQAIFYDWCLISRRQHRSCRDSSGFSMVEEEPQTTWGRTTDLPQASQIASSHINFSPLARQESKAERGREIFALRP